MHNLGPRETLEKFGNRNFPYFRPSAFSLLRERREIHACSGFRFAPREEDDPTFSFRPPTCARISSKVEIEGPVFPNSAPVEMQHSSFSPRVNIVDWQTACKYPEKRFFDLIVSRACDYGEQTKRVWIKRYHLDAKENSVWKLSERLGFGSSLKVRL